MSWLRERLRRWLGVELQVDLMKAADARLDKLESVRVADRLFVLEALPEELEAVVGEGGRLERLEAAAAELGALDGAARLDVLGSLEAVDRRLNVVEAVTAELKRRGEEAGQLVERLNLAEEKTVEWRSAVMAAGLARDKRLEALERWSQGGKLPALSAVESHHPPPRREDPQRCVCSAGGVNPRCNVHGSDWCVDCGKAPPAEGDERCLNCADAEDLQNLEDRDRG